MKKIVLLLLLLAIVLPTILVMLSLEAHILAVRSEWNSSAEKTSSSSQTILLSPKDFILSRTKEHEIRVDNHLYDLISVSSENGMIVCRVMKDSEEEQLLELLSLFENKDPKKKAPSDNTIGKLFSITALLPEPAHKFYVVPERCARLFFYDKSFYQSIMIGVGFEPPEQL